MAVDNTHFKGCWRPEEDEALRKAVAIHGEKNWSVVARHFNTLMGRPALLGRAPKQCRSRYLQQLVPGIKTGEWSPEEEEILVEGHKQFGNQWTLIASMLPGRTETSVKNHYNCTARRKVPTDLSRMTTLQRYLATIGVISLNNTRGSKTPALGSGYPSSSSSQFFHNHGNTATRSNSKAARSAPISPGDSPQQYEEYQDEEQQQHQGDDYAQQLMYQQHHTQDYEAEQYQQQYAEYAAYEQHAGYVEQVADADNAEGAADGLLQLARAALMHLDEEEEQDEHQEQHEPEPAGSHAAQQDPVWEADMQEDTAAQLQHAQQQLRQLRQHPASRSKSRAAGAGSSSPGPAGLWGKPEVLPVVRSNSEDSDHTAEEEEEGSPMAEANLKLQLRQALHPSSSLVGGKRSPLAHAVLPGGGKRHRSMWEQPGSSPVPGTAAHQRLHRPVLDVSEPVCGTDTSAVGGDHSPVSPAEVRGSSPAEAMGTPDAQTQLLALMMQAFMGAAAAGGEPSTPAAALSTNHLAALARVMQLSGLAGAGNMPCDNPAAPVAAQNAVADVLAAMVQGSPVGGNAGSTAAWSSSLAAAGH